MSEIPHKPIDQPKLVEDPRSLRGILLWSCLVLVFVLTTAAPSRGSSVVNPSVASVAPGSAFAIADFDGDHRPDLASIQIETDTSSVDDYWIQFRFSASERSPIRLVAPAGGLLIEARDVNGDHAIDLVLATSLFRQPVAIFLNDGHGVFSRVAPSSFPEAFSKLSTSWDTLSVPSIDAVGFPEDSRADVCAQAKGLLVLQRNASPVQLATQELFARSLPISASGRAPPSEVLHF